MQLQLCYLVRAGMLPALSVHNHVEVTVGICPRCGACCRRTVSVDYENEACTHCRRQSLADAQAAMASGSNGGSAGPNTFLQLPARFRASVHTTHSGTNAAVQKRMCRLRKTRPFGDAFCFSLFLLSRDDCAKRDTVCVEFALSAQLWRTRVTAQG